MRILIVGAGASVEEGKRLGLQNDQILPVISNFAKKLWNGLNKYNPHPFLYDYLKENNHDPGGTDPVELFIQLENSSPEKINIEKFFEFCWINIQKGKYPLARWDDMIYHGIGDPINLFLSQFYFENGVGWKNFSASQAVGSKLLPLDVIVNLNYETIFELGLEQINKSFVYSPNNLNSDQLLIVKPHGSLNLKVTQDSFCFGQPGYTHIVLSSGETIDNFRGIIPPILDKTYDQHPIAKLILAPTENLNPDVISFWGVGFTSSDFNLSSLYKGWLKNCQKIEIINPDQNVANSFSTIFDIDLNHIESFLTLDDWLSSF